MGVRILGGEDGACLYDSVTMWAFGPIFEDHEQAESFLQWLPAGIDARTYSDKDLEAKHADFMQHLEDEEDEDGEAA